MRILHTGDLHLSEGARFEDTLGCLTAMVDDAIAQGVTHSIVGGDMSGVSVPHVMGAAERNALGPLLQRLADRGPVIIEYGNHDSAGDLDEFALLEARHQIRVISEPSTFIAGGVKFFVLPYPWKRSYSFNPASSIEGQNAAVEQDLRAIFESWRADAAAARGQGIPTVFAGHVTIGGCLIAGGEVMPTGQEIEVSVTDLQALGVDYCAGSHIHLAQEMAPGIWYAGSPSRSSFGEEDEKGYLIVDVESGRPPIVSRRLTPARRFVTVSATWDAATGDFTYDKSIARVPNAEVRLRIEIPEEAAATCPLDRLLARLKELGAVAVKLEPRILPSTRVRSEAITQAVTTIERLRAYWATLNGSEPPADQQERCVEKLVALESEIAA